MFTDSGEVNLPASFSDGVSTAHDGFPFIVREQGVVMSSVEKSVGEFVKYHVLSKVFAVGVICHFVPIGTVNLHEDWIGVGAKSYCGIVKFVEFKDYTIFFNVKIESVRFCLLEEEVEIGFKCLVDGIMFFLVFAGKKSATY